MRAKPLTKIIRAARICTLTERVVAIHLLAASQACEIRGRVDARPSLALLIESLRRLAAPTYEDRPWTPISRPWPDRYR